MSFLYINHLVIETISPMAIGTGERELGFDNQLVRDINRLPYIPATSIAGVWRNLTKVKHGNELADLWFGQLGHNSKLTISQGNLLDSENNIVKGLITKEAITNDSLLSFLQQSKPIHRERVRLNDRGVAIEKGKFDHILLPRGVRFCITLQWQGDSEEELDQFSKILSLWHEAQFAFGSSATNGLGQIKLIGQAEKLISLANNPLAGIEIRKARSESLISTKDSDLTNNAFAKLSVRGIGTWRSGHGSHHLSDKGQDIDADIITYSEPRITWLNDNAHISKNTPVLPGSTWKGIIAHRFAYHLRRLNGQWAETLQDTTHEEWVTRPKEVDELFGFANENTGHGQAGKLIFHDTDIKNFSTVVRYHNAIDRFTGGVIRGALYSEELLEHPEFELRISAKQGATITSQHKAALQATFDDIEQGTLAIGGGSGRGHSHTERNGIWEINWKQLTVIDHESREQGTSE